VIQLRKLADEVRVNNDLMHLKIVPDEDEVVRQPVSLNLFVLLIVSVSMVL
jgi:hypothetical protein